MMLWQTMVEPEMLGLIPGMLDEDDPDSAAVQFDKHYQHGGGWRPFKGHVLTDDYCLQYPGDPPLKPLAWVKLRDEVVIIYEYEWVAVIQADKSLEVCRMD